MTIQKLKTFKIREKATATSHQIKTPTKRHTWNCKVGKNNSRISEKKKF